MQGGGSLAALHKYSSYGSEKVEHREARTIDSVSGISSLRIQHGLYPPFLAHNHLDKMLSLQVSSSAVIDSLPLPRSEVAPR